MSPVPMLASFPVGFRASWQSRSRSLTHRLLLASTVLLIAPIASAKETLCFPKDINPQILKSPIAGDYLPDWTPPSGVGTGWSFTKISRHGAFLKGILNTSHGNPTTGIIYVIASEWDCQ